MSVGTFVERWEKLDKSAKDGGPGPGGKAAKKILAQRGLTEAVMEEAKALLKKLGKIDGPLPDLPQLEQEVAAFDKAESELWAWYLEWSEIIRTTIKDRNLLKQLGFLRNTGGGAIEEDDTETEDESAVEEPK